MRLKIQGSALALIFLVQLYSGAADLNIKDFITSNCVDCHNEKKHKGKIRLDNLDYSISKHDSVYMWQDILDVLNSGEMPPEDEPQPKKEELTFVIGKVTENLKIAHKKLAATGGVISMRHLNKREYYGSIKDLFGADLPQDVLADDSSAGFDTNGSHQYFSLRHLENFQGIARKLVANYIEDYSKPIPELQSNRHDPEIRENSLKKKSLKQYDKVMALINAGAPFSKIAKVNPKIADAGQIRLFKQRYKARSAVPRDYLKNPLHKNGVTGKVFFNANVQPGALYKISICGSTDVETNVRIKAESLDIGSVNFKALKGEYQTKELSFKTGAFDNRIGVSFSAKGLKGGHVDYVNISGPYPQEASFFESVARPLFKSKDVSDEDVAKALKIFAERAFRYQVVDQEYINALVKLYRNSRDLGESISDSLINPFAAILTAPSFLYIKEKSNGKRSILSQKEYAIRMAYFLWGAPPDQELYDIAKAGQLYDKPVAKAQLDRMLLSAKADNFLESFIDQWSDIKRFDEIDLPKNMQGDFKQSARRELSEFFKVLVRENLPVDNLIDSDFAVVDSTLARHYKLKGVSDGFQKIALPANSPRGGLLGQAAFLIMGTSGPRTSPTIRGTIIRETFLHDPPPPPPPNVSGIDAEKGPKLTVRELVEKHQEIPQCASCHAKIDPIGYGLENFDYLGNWRTTEVLGGVPPEKKKKSKKDKKPAPVLQKVAVNAKGFLPNGDSFNDFDGLKKALYKKKNKLAESIYESLLSYGIGRDIEFVDEADINENLSSRAEKNYLLKEMIFEVITSKTFVTK